MLKNIFKAKNAIDFVRFVGKNGKKTNLVKDLKASIEIFITLMKN